MIARATLLLPPSASSSARAALAADGVAAEAGLSADAEPPGSVGAASAAVGGPSAGGGPRCRWRRFGRGLVGDRCRSARRRCFRPFLRVGCLGGERLDELERDGCRSGRRALWAGRRRWLSARNGALGATCRVARRGLRLVRVRHWNRSGGGRRRRRLGPAGAPPGEPPAADRRWRRLRLPRSVLRPAVGCAASAHRSRASRAIVREG